MTKIKPLLIAIPTFERYELLLRTMKDLSRFDASVFDVIVINNASPDIRYKTDLAQELRILFPLSNYKITHNPSNLGISGNIIKCFESSLDYEWIWVLSDDDPINQDFQLEELILFLEHLNQNISYVGLCGVSNAAINGEAAYYNVCDFLKNVPIAGILLISTLILRVDEIIRRLCIGISTAHTLCPHVAIILNGISSKNGFYTSTIEPIQWNPSDHRFDSDKSLAGRSFWGMDVFNLINAFEIGLNKKEVSLLHQVLATNYVHTDCVIKECYFRYKNSFFQRMRFITNFATAVMFYDPRIASKVGGFLSFFLCHTPITIRFFCWLRVKSKKVFPHRRKRRNLRY
jgi:glycosyltransferase involved in cell wall biosynthesis